MQINMNVTLPLTLSEAGNWLPQYPNPADFRFDYYKLLLNAPNGLAFLPLGTQQRSVAIVGAGAAGMTVARELLRCGFNVTIYEASDRIGGRLYTRENPLGQNQSGMEMGAMRMPFFSKPGDANCILEYYLLQEPQPQNKAIYAQFPNPGTAPGGTGIYLNQGFGPNHEFDVPRMIRWAYDQQPDNETIRNLANKATRFVDFFVNNIKDIYVENSNRWPQLWNNIVAHYEGMTFDDLVMAPAMNVYAVDDGNLGGFGMTADEASLLYTIGTGDGSWGAFYSIGALWFIRCTMFGFGGAELQTIAGLGGTGTLPFYGQPTFDSAGRPLTPPMYQGIQSLVEYLFYCTAPNQPYSLYESNQARLFTQASVAGIVKQPGDRIQVRLADGNAENFDYVFVTSGQWATQMSTQFLGFSQAELPEIKITAQHTQHNISSCKLFFPLTEQYWTKPGNLIPQVIVTDTYIQDAYALAWNTAQGDQGVILASYTWEDDSLKLLPFDQGRLVDLVLAKLQQITLETVQQDITEYIVKGAPVMIQWIHEPTYDGCAKLYRQRDEAANFIDLAYNQDFGAQSHLYFAGENYSVEGGWTEPALRSAIDGVMQLLHHAGAEFQVNDFNFDRDYPRWTP